MIEVIQQQFKESMSFDDKLNVTRELLQVLCLKIMSDKKMFEHVAFLGGTSLRILFNLRRFSEDLDFSLIKKEGYSTEEINKKFIKAFGLYGFRVETKMKSVGAVQSIMMKFVGLLKELGLSNLPQQKLLIKWDVDTNPPLGGNVIDTIVNKTYVFGVSHYDLPSLYAGKLHACFYRTYTKGRDFYDFAWYLGKKIKPNLTLLNNSIRQSQEKDENLNDKNFKNFLLRNIERINFNEVRKDVERFLEDKNELNIFDLKMFQNTINTVYV
ncbi:hypothetical protein MNBD_UNCLBAC01-2120 [hydrothermal vent metagenome]|uniref:Nucleotidyl transferase AbiEii/AbiGii toxin family protein n=1 Tax=hydrothermal vent metagenome TaxID=652676 RepID=A0A3B1E0Q8_9ZZZZ